MEKTVKKGSIIAVIALSFGLSLSGRLMPEDLSSFSNKTNPRVVLSDTSSVVTPNEATDILACSSTYNIDGNTAMFNGEPQIKKLINLIKKEDIEENYCPAIDFLNKLNEGDSNFCVQIINQTFRRENYSYAYQLLGSVISSDIEYLSSWFKDILLEAKKIESVSSYANDIYDMYSEVLDRL